MASPIKIIEPTEPLSWWRLIAWIVGCALFLGVVGTLLDHYDKLPTTSEPPATGIDLVYGNPTL